MPKITLDHLAALRIVKAFWPYPKQLDLSKIDELIAFVEDHILAMLDASVVELHNAGESDLPPQPAPARPSPSSQRAWDWAGYTTPPGASILVTFSPDDWRQKFTPPAESDCYDCDQ